MIIKCVDQLKRAFSIALVFRSRSHISTHFIAVWRLEQRKAQEMRLTTLRLIKIVTASKHLKNLRYFEWSMH